MLLINILSPCQKKKTLSLCLGPSGWAVSGGQACSGHEAGRWSAGSEQAAYSLGSADGGKGGSRGVLLLTSLAWTRGVQRGGGTASRQLRCGVVRGAAGRRHGVALIHSGCPSTPFVPAPKLRFR
jgi:hypothetical protein